MVHLSGTTKIGPLTLTLFQDKIAAIRFSAEPHSTLTSDTFAKSVWQALLNYFENPESTLNLPLHLNGTPFQKKVWAALRAIPTGKTMTYGDLANKLKTSPRAIGNACRANPIPIIIPCHRVVAQSHLGGYAGQRKGALFNIKTWLLQHEAEQHYDQANCKDPTSCATGNR